MSMEIEQKKVGKAIIIKPQFTTLGVKESTNFKHALADIVKHGSYSVILDLTNIQSIDSSGLGSLVSLGVEVLATAGRKFLLCGVASSIEKILNITHVNFLFPIYPNENASLKALHPEGENWIVCGYIGEDSSTLSLLTQCNPEKAQFIQFNSSKEFIEFFDKQTLAALFIEENQISNEFKNFIGSTHKALHLPVIGLFSSPVKGTFLQDLRKREGISKAIELPLTKERVRHLMDELLEAIQTPLSKTKPSVQATLFEQYTSLIASKIEELDQLLEKVNKESDSKTIEALRSAVHKIAGSAGAYGYIKAGETCKKMELLLANPTRSSNFKESLEKLFSDLRFYFNSTFFKDLNQKSSRIQPLTKNQALLTSSDPQVISLITEGAKGFGFHVTSIQNPDLLNEALRQLGRPEVVILEKSFSNSSLDGLELIKEIKDKILVNGIKFGMILDEDDLETHIKASEIGVDNLVNKPLSRTGIKNFLQKMMKGSSSHAYKVLVVDDDPDVCTFIKECLQQIDVNVEIESDETRILKKLKEYHPHLLFLDINLPKYNGWALLKTLRADVRYKDLKVIIITSNDSIESLRQTHDVSFDDIWGKPLDKNQLQKRVHKMAESYSGEVNIGYQPSSFMPLKEFSSLLQVILDSSINSQSRQYLVIVSSPEYGEILKRGFGAIDDFIISTEKMLNQLITRDIIRGYLGKGLFAFLFSGISNSEIENLVQKCLDEAEYKITIEGTDYIFVTLCAKGVAIPNLSLNSEEVISKAESLFYQAEGKPREMFNISQL